MEIFIEKLSQLNHRLSGTVNDSIGAKTVQDIFNSFGFETQSESFRTTGTLAYRFALNIFLLLTIYFFLKDFYLLSISLYLFVALSFWGELTFSYHLLRLFMPVHKSSNVEVKINQVNDGKRVVVVAHHDSPRTGILYHISDWLAPMLSKCPAPFNRFFFLPFLAMLLLGISLIIRPVSSLSEINILFSIFSILILGITLIVFVEMGFSKPSTGANDNGSGLLVLLEIARRFSLKKISNISVNLLATGAEEMGFFGIKHYVKYHKELDKDDTIFINLECVGGGTLYWATGEEYLMKLNYAQKGIDIINHFEKEGIIPSLPRTPIMAPTDAGPLAQNGFKVLTLIGLKDKTIPINYHRMSDTFDKLDRPLIIKAADIIEGIIRNYK